MNDIDKLIIEGGKRLQGEISVSGSKNAASALIPAILLADEPCTLENLPDIDDVELLASILKLLGAKVEYGGYRMTVDPRSINTNVVPDYLARRMRASLYFVGAFLGRCGEAEVGLPGGCDIGARPFDQHIKGFNSLGAQVETRHGMMIAGSSKLAGNEVYLDFPSVGATINIMMAAVKSQGNTLIIGAAKEPHVVDTANFLSAMGASIKGAGTDIIRIRGVKSLHGCTYTIIPDQVETGTMMIAAAATKGDVTIHGAIPVHMEAVMGKLLELGASVEADEYSDLIRVHSSGNHRHVNIKTQVYPGFPTDLQQPLAALLTTARGTSVVTETIYESRFKYLDELRRMGSQSRVNDRVAMIEGVSCLTGCPVTAIDLRAGAALVVGGLMAEGVTTISNIHHIDRGYERIEEKLAALGADIRRVKEQ